MKVRVNVDLDLCIGSGACYRDLPEVYEEQSDGTVAIKKELGGDGAILEDKLAQRALEIVDECPVNALITEKIE